MRRLTVDLGHEWLNDVVPDHLKVGVADPVRDRGARAGEKVVEDRHLVTEEHEAVDQVGAYKAGTAGDWGTGRGGRVSSDRGTARVDGGTRKTAGQSPRRVTRDLVLDTFPSHVPVPMRRPHPRTLHPTHSGSASSPHWGAA